MRSGPFLLLYAPAILDRSPEGLNCCIVYLLQQYVLYHLNVAFPP